MQRALVAAMGVVMAAGVAWGQEDATPRGVPPQLKLGERVRAYQAGWKGLSTVVVVTDARSYLEAIAGWTPSRRYPVLIDLGDRQSREQIARFVRGYKAKSVVRWNAPEDAPTKGMGVGEESFAAVDRGAVRGVLARVLAMKEEAGDDGAIVARFKELGHVPPGVVLANTSDPAWTAGVALAAGRGQPLAWVVSAKGFGGAYNTEGAAAFVSAAEEAAKATGYTWDAQGDEIEAVTLALNVPVKYDPGSGAKHRLALTDAVARHGAGDRAGQRWGWSGQVPGNAADAAYRAMCSLFLQPASAWVFDGYESKGEWHEFDGTKAADALRAGGLKVEVMDEPRQGVADWRARAARVVGAGLVMVNTKGNNNYFELPGGQCRTGDVPMLDVPAAVHFVHSWSAQQPDDRATIAARWMERGAYAYYGSVDEPFLKAFVPTPLLAQRIIAGAPFVVAARLDTGPVWKTASVADPLLTFAEVKAPVEEEVPLKGGIAVGASLREMLTENTFAEAIGEMVMQGRDEDVVKLVNALVERQPARVTPDVAKAAILAAFRRGENRMVYELFKKLDASARREGDLLDALWLASYADLQAGDRAVIELLAQHPRPDQAGPDRAAAGG
jgi:hypothetical protein